jgi:hypothetical protein
MDTPSIAFRVTNFNATNMAALERGWSKIASSLRLAAQLLANFGFSERTLTANSVVIPIAYYLHRRGAHENYLTLNANQEDRAALRSWVVRSLLKAGVWGSGLDPLLLDLRAVIRDYGANEFPAGEIETAMTRRGKSLRFETDEVDDLLSLPYGDKRIFPLLSLLYPGMNFKNEFHVDHIFPRSKFAKKALTNGPIAAVEFDRLADLAERLPNLQLLEGPVNVAKQSAMPASWLAQHFVDATARDAYRAWHDLGSLPDGIAGFERFFGERQERIERRFAHAPRRCARFRA